MIKNKKSKKNTKEDLSGTIIFITTTVLVILIILIAVIYNINKPADNQQNTGEVTPAPQTSHTLTETEQIKTYDDVTVTGSVAEADSKVYKYFMSHYQDDYYRINESLFSIIMEGKYTEYYETEILGYSKQGYIYKENAQCSYEDYEYSSSVVSIYTPEKSYLVYPDTQSYFIGEQNTQNYANKVDFPGDTLTTGEININGRKYYYEEAKDEQGISYRYCFDDNGTLVYTITSATSGTITTRHIEYKNSVDYSLFKVPENYTLVEDYMSPSE